jgi:hypothetical protein
VKEILTIETQSLISEGVLACNHASAPTFFIESIAFQCPFRAYPCSGGWDGFTRGNCLSCGNGGCPEMGINAINSKGKAAGKYYLFTNDESPFGCGKKYTMFICTKCPD